MDEMILGCETPRIYTPPRRELTPDTTHGFAAIAFAEEVLELKLFPWQKWLLLHALELNEDGLYRFRTVVVEVARQSGKTLVMLILALWHIYALDSRMVIGTAQDLSRSEKSWAEAVEYATENDELAPLVEDIKRGHPKVLTLISGCEYRVAAASRRGGRGFSGDLVLMDELREHQSWDSWAAVVNTMNARPKAQAWAFSNAGDVLSVVLRYLRACAHRDLGWPDGDADAEVLTLVEDEVQDGAPISDVGDEFLGWFEWSAPPHAARSDRQVWAQANPSMNHTEVTENCITERAIAAALRTSPPHVFDMECMCRWVSLADGGPFPEGAWQDTLDAKAAPADGARSAICVEVSGGKRERGYIARAAMDDDDHPVFGIWEDRQGTDWVLPWLLEHRPRYNTIVLRSGAGTPALSLWDSIEAAGLPLEKWAAADVSAAHGQMFDRLRDKQTKHLPHPGLDMAATSAAIKIQAGGGWIIDPAKSPCDTAPLTAALGAVWGLAHLPDDRPSIYSGEDGVDVLIL
jgi:hypothetical protein